MMICDASVLRRLEVTITDDVHDDDDDDDDLDASVLRRLSDTSAFSHDHMCISNKKKKHSAGLSFTTMYIPNVNHCPRAGGQAVKNRLHQTLADWRAHRRWT